MQEVITPQTEYEKAIKLLEELIQRDLEEQKEDIQKLWELLKELEFINDKNKLLPHTKYVKEVALFLLRRTAKPEYEDVFWRAMLLETPFKFESYIYYLEKNRPLDKQFYRPRQMTLKTVVDDLQDLYDDKLDTYALSMPSRVGKALADDTPILTSKGWKKHGDLKVGDYVYGLDGELVKVTKVFPKTYANKRVWFKDNTFIDTHENHEWLIYDRNCRRERIVETKELEQNCWVDGRGRYYLPIPEPTDNDDVELFVDPYVLGAWLGDGRTTNPDICEPKKDEIIKDTIVEKGYEVSWSTVHKDTGVLYWGFKELRKDLQKYGMCHSRKTVEKYIPEQYLVASKKQRLELLAGLLDTDGCLKKGENRYDYSTVSKKLRDGVVSLVSTFGWRVCATEYEPRVSSSGIHGRQTVYRISFNPTFEIPCRVPRKQLKTFSEQRRISVRKVETIESTSANCISVEGGIYRAGKRLIPTHNSTTGLLFLTWNALTNPNSHSALGGHSGRLTKGFYKELLNFFTEKEYAFGEMYSYLHPNHTLIQEKSAEDMTITLDEPDRFATLTCRGIDATWTGDIDVSKDGYLYVDDLVRDRQHSLSPSRMENTYQEFQNKMLDRVNDGGKLFLIGTLWNVSDPIERERKLNDGNPRARFRKIPALNKETGESNFQYKVKGFSTKYYLDMKARLDKAEWEAKYQQQPFVREGLLFEADQMEYFDGVLPEGEYTPVAVVDVAFGGGDRLSMPIGMLNKETRICYIVDWLFNKGDKNVTKPLIINKIRTHEIPEIQFEKNSGGELYKDEIQEDLRNEKITCLLKSKSAPNNMSKEQKIQYYAPNIMKFVFLTPNRPTAEQKALDTANGTKRYARNNDYDLAMDETLMFVTEGKNLHDDAPDSLSQLAMYLDTKANKKATIISSPF